VDLCSAVIVSSLTDAPLDEEFARLYPQMAHVAFGQDVEIWKDKVYREDPILCDGTARSTNCGAGTSSFTCRCKRPGIDSTPIERAVPRH
jgi:hypothetical protein